MSSRFVERLAWAGGIICLAVWGGLHFSGAASARRDVANFYAAQPTALAGSAQPDMSLWSPVRVRGFEESLTRDASSVLAVLRIPKIKLEVPVLEGTDDWTLNRAVGHIEDTASPGAAGNVGIAGHRDGFFRGLKDIAAGDILEMETRGRIDRYTIDLIWIVQPEDVWVIDPTPAKSVTLVTCYPFYFIGSAPQRYIVRATLSSDHAADVR
jgi:sortase A